MTKSIYKITTLIISLTLISCASEYILDPIDYRLPIYSETGNNVAGALINNEAWSSKSNSGLFLPSNKNFHIEINTTLNKLSFNFAGESSTYKHISIIINKLNIEKFEDLKKLSNKKITLDGQSNFAVLSKSFFNKKQVYNPTQSSGQIYIKNVELNYGETNSENRIIISGTFGFDINLENRVIQVHYGRFDYRISEKNLRIIN